MSPFIQVLEVFRPAQRKGPVVVVKTASVAISAGTTLASVEDPALRLEVIAVDFPTEKFRKEGKLAVVVQPDLGDELRSGCKFTVVSSPD